MAQETAPKGAPSRPATAKKKPGAQNAEIPLHISASRLEADQEKNRIVFKGKVKALYGDATLYADELWVMYQPRQGRSSAAAESPLGELGGENIDRIEARGKVRFVQGDRVATGAKAIYYRSKDEIVLLGRPQVWRGENHLRGSKITFNLASQKVVVEGSAKQRVEAHLYQAPGGGTPPRDLFPGGPPGGQAPRPR